MSAPKVNCFISSLHEKEKNKPNGRPKDYGKEYEELGVLESFAGARRQQWASISSSVVIVLSSIYAKPTA
jgi:hypothetical protein